MTTTRHAGLNAVIATRTTSTMTDMDGTEEIVEVGQTSILIADTMTNQRAETLATGGTAEILETEISETRETATRR